jgi:hypothetical protein
MRLILMVTELLYAIEQFIAISARSTANNENNQSITIPYMVVSYISLHLFFNSKVKYMRIQMFIYVAKVYMRLTKNN